MGAVPSLALLEESIIQAVFNLDIGKYEIRNNLQGSLFLEDKKIIMILQSLCVKEIDINSKCKAILIRVPRRLLPSLRDLHQPLVRDLKKKLPNKEIIIAGEYIITPKSKSRSLKQRPRSQTLTSVHKTILEDVVYPYEIVGKRIRYSLDGHKIVKIYLTYNKRKIDEHKLEIFNVIYKKITGKDVVFINSSE